MSSKLPVREMVLYKHGVGFFVREGKFTGEEIALTFRRDEINDVLKSLAAFDRAGGQVLGVHYQTPMDKAARLANSSIRLSDSASLSDLIRDLRGRQALLELETTPGTVETVAGRIVGMDERGGMEREPARVAVLIGGGQVRVFPLDILRTIDVDDRQAEYDLSYFLDTSMSEDERRTVTVRLSEGAHHLAVYYVAPSPTWRVSYRAVAESDEGGATGKALLQGWGLFDNRLEEDLEDVRVTLVAGQPISFIYELYASRIPPRPVVQDETRVAPGPVEFEAKRAAAPILGAARGMAKAERALPEALDSFAAAPPALSMADIAASTPIGAETKETGETFQYIVTAPVTVKRGESVLAPIIGSEVQYERELLYNGAKLPDHPVAALRFENSTGLTLERGPVTVVEDGDYKGEAVVPFTKAGNPVYLPYAVELGVNITEREESSLETAGLNIEKAVLVHQQYLIRKMIYTLENTTDKPKTITLEAPITTGWELSDTAVPDVETAHERRWRVTVKAHSSAKFTRRERQIAYQRTQVRDLKYRDLERYLRGSWLDQETFNRLAELLDSLALIEKLNKEKQSVLGGRQDIYKQQEQLRANLGTLQPTGQEAALRNRMLAQLEASQDKLDEIDRQAGDLDKQIGAAEAKVQQIIKSLG